MSTKQPIYKGPKKNHAAVFVGVPIDDDMFNDAYQNRVRIFHSQERHDIHCTPRKIVYCVAGNSDNTWFRPCWYQSSFTDKQNIRAMIAYDGACSRETIFLGYVKDCE